MFEQTSHADSLPPHSSVGNTGSMNYADGVRLQSGAGTTGPPMSYQDGVRLRSAAGETGQPMSYHDGVSLQSAAGTTGQHTSSLDGVSLQSATGTRPMSYYDDGRVQSAAVTSGQPMSYHGGARFQSGAVTGPPMGYHACGGIGGTSSHDGSRSASFMQMPPWVPSIDQSAWMDPTSQYGTWMWVPALAVSATAVPQDAQQWWSPAAAEPGSVWQPTTASTEASISVAHKILQIETKLKDQKTVKVKAQSAVDESRAPQVESEPEADGECIIIPGPPPKGAPMVRCTHGEDGGTCRNVAAWQCPFLKCNDHCEDSSICIFQKR